MNTPSQATAKQTALVTALIEANKPIKPNVATTTETNAKYVFGKQYEGKCDGSELKPTHLKFEGPTPNKHIDRRLTKDLTLVRYLRTREPSLLANQYYARMLFNPAKSTASNLDGEIGLATIAGQTLIAKKWMDVWSPELLTRVCLVEVNQPELYFIRS